MTEMDSSVPLSGATGFANTDTSHDLEALQQALKHQVDMGATDTTRDFSYNVDSSMAGG